jgi:hypothetical protein
VTPTNLDELFAFLQSFLLRPDVEHGFPNAIVVDVDGMEMLALDMGSTFEAVALLRHVIRSRDAVCAAWFSEAWSTNLEPEDIIRKYGRNARRDFRKLPPLHIYCQDQFGRERFREWRIHGNVPERTYELLIDGLDDVTIQTMRFRPLFTHLAVRL